MFACSNVNGLSWLVSMRGEKLCPSFLVGVLANFSGEIGLAANAAP
jgi:hypothetical protein